MCACVYVHICVRLIMTCSFMCSMGTVYSCACRCMHCMDMHAYVHAHVYACMRAYMCVCMYVCVYVYVCRYTYILPSSYYFILLHAPWIQLLDALITFIL